MCIRSLSIPNTLSGGFIIETIDNGGQPSPKVISPGKGHDYHRVNHLGQSWGLASALTEWRGWSRCYSGQYQISLHIKQTPWDLILIRTEGLKPPLSLMPFPPVQVTRGPSVLPKRRQSFPSKGCQKTRSPLLERHPLFESLSGPCLV